MYHADWLLGRRGAAKSSLTQFDADGSTAVYPMPNMWQRCPNLNADHRCKRRRRIVVLGGNNSSEIRVWLNGETNKEPYPHIGDLVREFEQTRRKEIGPKENYEDDERIATFRAEKNIHLMLNERVNNLEKQGDRVAAVISQNTRTAGRTRTSGRWFVDCTGDATVGYLAKADYEMTEKGHQGGSNLWTTEDTKKPSSFPRCPWAFDIGTRVRA